MGNLPGTLKRIWHSFPSLHYSIIIPMGSIKVAPPQLSVLINLLLYTNIYGVAECTDWKVEYTAIKHPKWIIFHIQQRSTMWEQYINFDDTEASRNAHTHPDQPSVAQKECMAKNSHLLQVQIFRQHHLCVWSTFSVQCHTWPCRAICEKLWNSTTN